MLQSSTHSLEVLAAELTHDVRWASLGSPVGSAFDPRSHAFDFVLDQGLPVFAVDVAFLTVEQYVFIQLTSIQAGVKLRLTDSSTTETPKTN